MPGRQVRTTLATYVDETGRRRTALRGDSVAVHPGFVDRFDRLNVAPGDELAEVAPEVADGLAEWLAAEELHHANVDAWLAAERFAVESAEFEHTTPDQAEPAVPANSEPVADDVLEIPSPPKRTRSKAANTKGD